MTNDDQNTSESVTKHILKKWLVPTLIIIFLVLVFLFGDKCQYNKPVEQPDTLSVENKAHSDSIRLVQPLYDRYYNLIDSINKSKTFIKTKIIHHYTTLHDSIPVYLRDDLDSLNADWIELDIANLNVIGYQDSIITTQKKEINLYKAITHNDTLRMNDMRDSIKSNRKYFRGLRHGIGIGLGVGAVIYVGSKITP